MFRIPHHLGPGKHGSQLRAILAGWILLASQGSAGWLDAPPGTRPAVRADRNEERFEAVVADALEFRIRVPKEPCIDEIEIHSPEDPERNLALDPGVRLESSGDYPGYAIHQLAHIRDGRHGNDHSWLAREAAEVWVRLILPRRVSIDRVVWGRDREGRYQDRVAREYEFRLRLADGSWKTVADHRGRAPGVELRRDAAKPWLGPSVQTAPTLPSPGSQSGNWTAGGRRFRISRWDGENGLPSLSLTAMARTPDGFLWLATGRGLVRFDGTRFTTLTPHDHPGLPSGQVAQLLTLPNGELWVRWEGSRAVRVRNLEIEVTANGKPADIFRFIQSDGGILAQTLDRRIHRYGSGGWTPAPDRFVPLYDSLRSPVVDSHGKGWIIADSSTWCRVDGEGLTPVPLPGTFRGRHLVQAIAIPGIGIALFGANGTALLQRTDGSFGPVPAPLALGVHAFGEPVLFDRDGDLWQGSYGQGLLHVSRAGGRTLVPVGDTPTSTAITGLIEDAVGDIWISTAHDGLFRVSADPFERPAWMENLPSAPVHAIAHGASGTWIGVAGKGLMLAGREDAALQRLQLAEDYPWTVAEPEPGHLWVGSYGGGVVEIDLNDPTRHRARADGIFFALEPDGRGGVWAAGADVGLRHLTSTRSIHWGAAEGFPHGDIRALCRDPLGDEALWIGSRSGGLHHWDGSRFSEIRLEGRPEPLRVLALHRSADGTLWVGTDGDGLIRSKAGRLHVFGKAQGIPSEWVHAVWDDGSGGLWLATAGGAGKVDVQDLDAVALGQRERVASTWVRAGDGLPSSECSAGSQPLLQSDPSGRVWISTVRGPAILKPGGIQAQTEPPTLVVEEILCDGTRLVPVHGANAIGRIGFATSAAGVRAQTLRLPPGDHRLEIQYTVLRSGSGTPVRCRFRMDGLDTGWNDDGLRRRAEYSNLSHGRYRFHLEAVGDVSSPDRPSSSVSLDVLVEPTFTQTAFFRWTAGLAVAAGITIWYRTRIRRLERLRRLQQDFGRRLIDSQESERKRIAGEIHDSLEQNLLVIKNQAALAARQLPAAIPTPPALRQITESVSEAIEEVRNIAANLRPYQLDRLGPTRAIHALVRRLSESATVGFTCQCEDVDPALGQDAGVSLYRIVQECLNNVLRHSGAQSCDVRLRRDGGWVELRIDDDGRGFAVERAVVDRERIGGLGLAGMKERADMFGGTVSIVSAPGQGTRVLVRFPARDDSPRRTP